MKPLISRKFRSELLITPKTVISIPVIVVIGCIGTVGMILNEVCTDINRKLYLWSREQQEQRD